MAFKVLLLARELGLGGTERQLTETALALDRSRFEPHAGCFTAGGFRARELAQAGVPVIELGVQSFVSTSALSGALRLGAYLHSHRIDLVHAWDVPMDLFAVPVARFYRVPVVLASQRASRDLTSSNTNRLLRIADRLAHGIVVNSKAVARELGNGPNLRLVYNGIDTTRFHPEGERALSANRPVIGTVCALRPEKDLPTLMEAVRKLDANLLIVGSGPMLEQLKASANGACHFEPAVKDVAPWLRSIDIFVLPSLSEAFSNSLMEAMACGCCPVASEVGGNPELVTHGETGMLFPPKDAAALAERLDTLLRDPELRGRLAANAQRRMATEFTREAAAQRMGEVYEEFLKKACPSR